MKIKVKDAYHESFELFTRFIVKIHTSTIFIDQSKFCLDTYKMLFKISNGYLASKMKNMLILCTTSKACNINHTTLQ